MPVPGSRSGDNKGDTADPTAALPVIRKGANDPDAATEQLNARGQSGQGANGDKSRQRRRVGGGITAQDLLRREGKLCRSLVPRSLGP